jgi:hypothetical protein
LLIRIALACRFRYTIAPFGCESARGEGGKMASQGGEACPIRQRRWSWVTVAVITAVALGAVLRLLWGDDIEFKLDELWTFERVQHVGRTEPFPWLGMPTSCGMHNPGGSVWAFIALGRLFGVTEPPDLARACQLVNIAALVLLVAFAFWAVPRAEREPWLWAAALLAVNPLAVTLHRKIWPPALLPPIAMVVLIGWWYRERRWGAFTWGLAALLAVQLHLGALFLAVAFVLWAVLFDRPRVRWLAWLAGSCVGGMALLPWLVHVGKELVTGPVSQRYWVHALEFKFWTHWVAEPFGFGMDWALGKDFTDFLGYPHLGGRRTYLVLLLHLALLTTAVLLLARGVYHLWRERGRWRALVIGRDSPTAFTQNAALIGCGLVFTISLLPIHRHYVEATFPLMFVWLARLALGRAGQSAAALTAGRVCLLGVCVAQGLLSLCFLSYVHSNQRWIKGDYGIPYSVLRAGGLSLHGKPFTPQDMENPWARKH